MPLPTRAANGQPQHWTPTTQPTEFYTAPTVLQLYLFLFIFTPAFLLELMGESEHVEMRVLSINSKNTKNLDLSGNKIFTFHQKRSKL